MIITGRIKRLLPIYRNADIARRLYALDRSPRSTAMRKRRTHYRNILDNIFKAFHGKKQDE
jgi:hypothetical protein